MVRGAAATPGLAASDGVPVVVRIGMTTETEAEVLSGLDEGDFAIVSQRTSTEGGQGMGGPGMPMGVFRAP